MTGFNPLNAFQRLSEQCWEDSGKWFPFNKAELSPEDQQVWFLLTAMTGEAGEVLNVWKKYVRGSKTIEETLPLVREELIDVLIYWLNLMKVLNINVEEEYARKRAFNASRFDRTRDGSGTRPSSDLHGAGDTGERTEGES